MMKDMSAQTEGRVGHRLSRLEKKFRLRGLMIAACRSTKYLEQRVVLLIFESPELNLHYGQITYVSRRGVSQGT